MFRDVEKFIQIVSCFGKEEESLTEIRAQMYKQMKTKTSHSLLPDKKSMLQAIKCIHYQAYGLSRVYEVIISDLLLRDNSWIVNNENKDVDALTFADPVRFELHLSIFIVANKFNPPFT